MEKNNLKNLNIKTKLKALALSAVTLVTGISCGKSNDVKAPEQESSIIMEAETNTKPNKNTIESTVDNMIKEKGTKESKENNYVENYNYENEENNYVEEETNLETIEAKTENKTEAPSKVYEEEIVIPKKGASITPSTNHTTTKIKNSDIKVTTTKSHTQHPTTTKKVTTTQKHTTAKVTTTKPVTTTVKVTEPPVVTQPPRTDYNKYDLLSGDPATAAMALEKLSSELENELYRGCAIYRDNEANPHEECKTAIAILNYGSISPEALAYDVALGNYSEEDLIKYSHALDFAAVERVTGARVDFNKYVLDGELANFINQVNNAWLDYENGNEEEFVNIADDYDCNYYGIDHIKDYFITLAISRRHDYDLEEEYSGVYSYTCIYEDNIVKPMFNEYKPYIGKAYRR